MPQCGLSRAQNKSYVEDHGWSIQKAYDYTCECCVCQQQISGMTFKCNGDSLDPDDVDCCEHRVLPLVLHPRTRVGERGTGSLTLSLCGPGSAWMVGNHNCGLRLLGPGRRGLLLRKASCQEKAGGGGGAHGYE
jgi:hypothetical protein